MENALEIRDLMKIFPGSFELKGISFDIPRGTAVGLVGENGAGKSTTISLISGMIKADGGSVRVLGEDINSPAFTDVKNRIGTVLDEACLPFGLKAGQLGKVCSMIYTDWDGEAYRNNLRHFDLPSGKPFKDLSRGMKMKLSLAVALSHGAELLILDEATGGLDPMARDELIGELKDFISDGKRSILLSSHIVSDIEKLCDRIVFIHRGSLMFDRSKEELLREGNGSNLEEIVLDMVRRENR